MDKIRFFGISIVSLCMVTLTFFFVRDSIPNLFPVKNTVSPTVDLSTWQILQSRIERRIRKFPGISGIVVKDLSTGVTIRHNSTRLFPSASLVKIPIMAAVYQRAMDGKLDLAQRLILRRQHKAGGSGKLKYVRPGTSFTIRDLLNRMITESDNTATNMIAEYIGYEFINQTFIQIGLRKTNFYRPIMDLRVRDLGIENYTTAEEMSFILEQMYIGKLINSECSKEMVKHLCEQKINDRLCRKLPRWLTVAHKTGLQREVCHDVGIVYHPKGAFTICVLTDRVGNYRVAKRLISDISELVFDHYEGYINSAIVYTGVNKSKPEISRG